MNIELDLNEVMGQFRPWGLSLVVDGVRRKVRPITIADLAIMGNLRALSDAEMHAFFNGLFEGGETPVDSSGWEHAKLGAVMGIVSAYYAELVRKNSQLAADRVRSAAGTAGGR